MVVSPLWSHLNPGGKIILETFIVRTCRAVGEIIRVQAECGHRDPVDRLQANLGEVESPAEVRGVQGEAVLHLGHAGWEEAVWRSPQLTALSLIGRAADSVVPFYYFAKIIDVILPGFHFNFSISPGRAISLNKISNQFRTRGEIERQSVPKVLSTILIWVAV